MSYRLPRRSGVVAPVSPRVSKVLLVLLPEPGVQPAPGYASN